MTIYSITWEENGTRHYERRHTLTEAKKIMRQHPGAKGTKTKVWSNGDWEPMGEIKLTGSNKSFIANSPRNMKKANY